MQPEHVETIGHRYVLHELLGQGGMGSVHRATDRLTGSQVALKRVLASQDVVEFSTSYNADDFRLKLAQEFKLLSSLRHPNVIQVLDYGFDDQRQPFFTMEILPEAKTILEASMGKSVAEKFRLVAQMLQALNYLHHREILHRDLKPGNVLVVDDRVKVLDFGLSSMRDHMEHDDAGDGTTVGTLAYMPPEVLVGHPATEASDLYAVGMIAFEILLGQHPYKQEDAAQLVNSILYETPDCSLLDIDLEAANILEKLLLKEATDRYSSARQVLVDLNAVTDFDLPSETIEIRESFLQAARLVGRQAEIERLSTALNDTIGGKGSAWLLAGESGVGKSRLVDELRTLSLVEGAFLIRGQSVGEGSSPYQMWRNAFRWLSLLMPLKDVDVHLLKILMPDIIESEDIAATAQTAQLDPQEIQSRLYTLLETMLRSQQRPITLMFEDLHWARAESLQLLAKVVTLAEDLPLLIIASYRNDERPDLPEYLPDMQMINLNRLSQDEIAELSLAMLGDAGGQPQVVDLLQRETEGNIFFLIEVVRVLAEEAGELEQIGKMTLPQNVFAGGAQLIVQRRLQRLPDWTQGLLRYASVLGRQIDMVLLRGLDANNRLDDWMIQCVNAAVLEVIDGEWQFAHDKLRETILQDIPEPQRKKLHRDIAEQIEQLYVAEERAAPLAYHWGAASETAKEEFYVDLAGQQALKSGAYQEAMRYFEHALNQLDTPDMHNDVDMQQRYVRFQNKKAQAYLGLGDYKRAQHLYRNSLLIAEQIHDSPVIAESLSALGDVSYALVEHSRAREYYQESLGIYRELDDKGGVARILSSLGNVAYDLGDQNIAKQLYQQSLAISREIGEQWGMAGSLSSAEHVDDTLAQFTKDKKRLIAELDALLRAENHVEAAPKLYDLGNLAGEMAEYEEARQYLNRSLVMYRDLGDQQGVITVYNRLGVVNTRFQDFVAASKNLRRALQAAKDTHNITMILRTLINIATLRLTEGRSEYALELLAFILSHPECPDDMEDEAERMVFDIEGSLGAAVTENVWDKGKNSSMDDIVRQTLSIT